MFAEGSGAVGALVWGGVEGVDVNAWREFRSKVIEFKEVVKTDNVIYAYVCRSMCTNSSDAAEYFAARATPMLSPDREGEPGSVFI